MNPLQPFWELVLGTIIALLPVINPLASTPVFLAITDGDTPEQRRQQALRGTIYMVVILVSFLIGGTFIINFFGISIPGLRIAGGLVVAIIGLGMLGPPKRSEEERKREAEARSKTDVSFTPLAMPSGPGSIAVTVGFTSLARDWTHYGAIILGILIVAAIVYATLRLSGRIVQLIGANGMNAMSKVMGFLILCIGVQFIVNGILASATDPTLLWAVRDALAAP
jgi:multiple antibiotic resistance protein